MVTTITVDYTRDGDDWTVTVAGGEQRLIERAPGLIAARDRADTLVDSMVADEKERAVVHMIDGDAFAFTTAYLRARHGAPGGQPPKSGAPAGGPSADQLANHEQHDQGDRPDQ
jgi:endonuclease YncB( thermonuclease family)